MHGDVVVTEHEDLEDDFALGEGIQNADGVSVSLTAHQHQKGHTVPKQVQIVL